MTEKINTSSGDEHVNDGEAIDWAGVTKEYQKQKKQENEAAWRTKNPNQPVSYKFVNGRNLAPWDQGYDLYDDMGNEVNPPEFKSTDKYRLDNPDNIHDFRKSKERLRGGWDLDELAKEHEDNKKDVEQEFAAPDYQNSGFASPLGKTTSSSNETDDSAEDNKPTGKRFVRDPREGAGVQEEPESSLVTPEEFIEAHGSLPSGNDQPESLRSESAPTKNRRPPRLETFKEREKQRADREETLGEPKKPTSIIVFKDGEAKSYPSEKEAKADDAIPPETGMQEESDDNNKKKKEKKTLLGGLKELRTQVLESGGPKEFIFKGINKLSDMLWGSSNKLLNDAEKTEQARKRFLLIAGAGAVATAALLVNNPFISLRLAGAGDVLGTDGGETAGVDIPDGSDVESLSGEFLRADVRVGAEAGLNLAYEGSDMTGVDYGYTDTYEIDADDDGLFDGKINAYGHNAIPAGNGEVGPEAFGYVDVSNFDMTSEGAPAQIVEIFQDSEENQPVVLGSHAYEILSQDTLIEILGEHGYEDVGDSVGKEELTYLLGENSDLRDDVNATLLDKWSRVETELTQVYGDYENELMRPNDDADGMMYMPSSKGEDGAWALKVTDPETGRVTLIKVACNGQVISPLSSSPVEVTPVTETTPTEPAVTTPEDITTPTPEETTLPPEEVTTTPTPEETTTPPPVTTPEETTLPPEETTPPPTTPTPVPEKDWDATPEGMDDGRENSELGEETEQPTGDSGSNFTDGEVSDEQAAANAAEQQTAADTQTGADGEQRVWNPNTNRWEERN